MSALERPPKSRPAREIYDRGKVHREERVYKLRLQGLLVTEIAAELGVTDRQVRTYIQRVEERMKADLLAHDGEAGVHRQFAVLNHALDEALDAWEKSKEPSVKRSATKEVDATGNTLKTRVSESVATEIGNPGYLDAVLKAAREIRDLLGMDASTFRRLVLAESEEKEPSVTEDLSDLSTEELWLATGLLLRGPESSQNGFWEQSRNTL